jgi:hypothetical protein
MLEILTDDEARERLTGLRAAFSTHIPDTTIFIANIILVSTALRVAANLNDSDGLAFFGVLLPFIVFIKILGLALPSERESPAFPTIVGVVIGVAATALALWGSNEATNASLLQLDSPRLQAFLQDRQKVASEEIPNFQRGLALHCFQKPGPLPKDAAECQRLTAFFNAHPLPVSGDVE